MSIFAIADLHLSFSQDKPMDIYGGSWVNHVERINEKWCRLVEEKDTVIIPGDISWALKAEDSKADLDWIAALPGRKILVRGNHDLWWSSITRLNRLYDNMVFLQNNCVPAEDYMICGSRGWLCPDDPGFGTHDQKIYDRELIRLRFSLDAAKSAGSKKIIAAMHFPPTAPGTSHSGFTDIMEEYGVETVIFGHLHGADAHAKALQGNHGGVNYRLTACDYLTCCPLLIRK